MQLLNQLIKKYLLFSSFLILVSIPASYYFLNRLIINEALEILSVKQKKLSVLFSTLATEKELQLVTKMRDNVSIREAPVTRFPADTIFRTSDYDSIAQENILYMTHAYSMVFMGKPYLVTQRESFIRERALIFLVLKEQATLLLVLLCVLLLIHFRFSQIAWKPFYQTLQELQKYELEKDSVMDLPFSKIKEFNDLNQTILSLAEKSHRTYQAQKEFTENAAHEIQTPLAIFQSKLEVMMQHEHLDNQDADIIESLTEVSQRLSRISRGLLLLTKIDNNQFVTKETIDLPLLVQQLLQQFDGPFKEDNISHSLSTSGNATLIANVNLTDVLLSNLLSNAIRYNRPGGQVWIQLDQDQLRLTNTGDPTSIETGKMYERFSKSGKHPQSTGLGLAIVKKICDACGYHIAYSFDAVNALHTFCVSFS